MATSSLWKYIISVFVLLCLTFILLNTEDKLQEVPHQEALSKIVHGDRKAMLFLPYKNAAGNELTKAERKLLNEGKLTRRYFETDRREIKEIRCFPMLSSADTINERRLTILLDKEPFKNIELININCALSNMTYVHSRLFPSDTYSNEIDSLDYFRFHELDNMTLVASIIDQCGFPFTYETIKAAATVILEAGNRGLAEYYFHHFEEAQNLGLMDDIQYKALQSKVKGVKKWKTTDLTKIPDFFLENPHFANMEIDSLIKLKAEEITARMNKQL